jgi:hypothetical protein
VRGNQEKRNTQKCLLSKVFYAVLTRSVLSAPVSKNRVVDDGRETPENGRHREDFLRLLGGFHGIDVLVW